MAYRLAVGQPMTGVAESLGAGQMRFIVTLTGLDGTSAQTIHARRIYEAEDIVWNARFADVLSNAPEVQLQIDYAKFHDVVPLPDPKASPPR